MADLTLRPNRITLIDPLDPGGARVNAMSWERDVTEAIDGQINEYAYGRRVSISYGDSSKSLALKFTDLSQQEYDTMNSWLGKVVLYRDRHGRKIYGAYFSIGIADFRDSAYDIEFNLDSVTYSEEV